MLRPSYAVEIGSKMLTSHTQDVVRLEATLSIGLPIDAVELLLVGGRQLLSKVDEPVTVSLGYDDALVKTFTGWLDSIEHGVTEARLVAFGRSRNLLYRRANRVYINQSAGGIVRSLADEATVDVKECEEGAVFPMYVIDDRLNMYEHVLDLADRCNFDVFMTPEGQLVFKPYTPTGPHTFSFGDDIVSVAMETTPTYGRVSVYGESPSSRLGAETFHWLAKQEVKGEAGPSAKETVPLVIQDPVVRSQETATSVARATLDRQVGFFLTLTVTGAPEVRLGETVEIRGLADPEINDEYEVRQIRHKLSKNRGFTTTLCCGWRG